MAVTAKHSNWLAAATWYEALLQRYATSKSLSKTKQLHAQVIASGLLSSESYGLLTSSYALCGCFSDARRLFDETPLRTKLSYNAMIRAYTENGLPCKSLHLFVEMLSLGYLKPDQYTFPFVIRACGDLSLIGLGGSVHGLTEVTGFASDAFVGNSLLAMYMNCGDNDGAGKFFVTMPERNVVSWNTMISGYFRTNSAAESLSVFRKMMDEGVEADPATMVSVLPACGYLKDLEVGMEVHSLAKRGGFVSKLLVNNALMDMYVKCGRIGGALMIFENIEEKDVVTWTTMINGYILNGDARSALDLFRDMQFKGVRPNGYTLASLLSGCANSNYLKFGEFLHGWAMRRNLVSDVNVETSLIDMYAKCNCIMKSYSVFKTISENRTVPWNSILSGFIHNKFAREAILLFKEMLTNSVHLNEATMKSLLPAYAMLADIQQAINFHSYLIKSGFILRVDVVTGLIDIYSKCGCLDYARKIFDTIPRSDKDIFLWSVIIAGYGMHGKGEAAVNLFYQMVQSGLEPNEVTFTSALHACSHAGLVDDGFDLFNFMLKSSQVRPHADHYTCIVDLLGRVGRLKEAYDIIKAIPFPPTHAIWGALLGACVIHENVELGELAAKWLFEIEPENTGNYVLLGKIYSAVGRWKDAENVRQMINDIGLKKSPAHSFVEVRNM